MNEKRFQAMIWLMWLALPLTALRYWRVWDQLPVRMASHFDINGQANGWMSREVSLWFAMGFTALLLVIFTAVTYVAYRKHVPDRFAWALLGFFYLVIGMIYFIEGRVVEHSLNGRPVEVTPVLILTPVAIVALMAIYLRTKRGEALPADALIAEESHGSRLFAFVFVVPLVIESIVFVAVPLGAVRLTVALMFVLFAVIAAHAWTGFQYRFTPAGVEISTLGFRLRSIPLAQIRDYAIAPWSPLRGYGIRGVGQSRAYVWGNQGVRIHTSDGEVFLGHSEPARLVRDLDVIKQFSH